MKITNVLAANRYNAQAGGLKESAAKSLKKVVSTLTSQTQPVNADSCTFLLSQDELDSAAAMAYQKSLLCLATDNPLGASDINDLDTLNAANQDLKTINELLQKATDETLSKADRDQYQKLIAYYKNSLNSIGDMYIGKVYAAKKINDAVTFDPLKKNAPPIIMTDILGVSDVTAATAQSSAASLPSVQRATDSVNTQICTIKAKIWAHLRKAKTETAQNSDDTNKGKSGNKALQLVKTDMLKGRSATIFSQVNDSQVRGSKFSKKV